MSKGVLRYDAKRDANEPEIVGALTWAGAIIWRISKPCDLIVGFRGAVYLFEVKTKDGKLTPAEKKAHEEAREHGLIIHIIRSPEEALITIGAVEVQG